MDKRRADAYDPAADKWSTRAPLPTPRDHLALAAEGGWLYAIGGRIDGDYAHNLAANEAYDPATDGWQPRAALSTARSGIAAAVLAGRIVVVGGEAPAGTLQPGGGLRSRARRLERVRAYADRAPRARQCGSGRQDVRHRRWAHARRLGIAGERDFRALNGESGEPTGPDALNVLLLASPRQAPWRVDGSSRPSL
jgi:hypothetical protein